MTVLLLCGYRDRDENEKALFCANIDNRIHEIKKLGFDVICVLAGEFAEDQLRHCRNIMNCELVYDTQEQPNLATNLKAGLAGTDGSGCFVLPVEIPCPPYRFWHEMREQWRGKGFLTETNIYRMTENEGAPSHYGFPLLVTRSGNSLIKQIKGFRSLVDPRLKYSDLASVEQPL